MKNAAENREEDAKGAAGQKQRKGMTEERAAKRVASYGQKARSLQRLLEHKKDVGSSCPVL